MTLITIDRSVVEQALKALEKADRIAGYRNNWAEIFSLRAALEQPSVVGQEPVAWVEVRPNKFDASCRGVASVVDHKLPPGDYALYTHPQSLNCKSTQARLATLRGYVKEQPRQPPVVEQGPVAWMYDWDADGAPVRDWVSRDYDEAHSPTNGCHNIRPLYTHPQPRQPLTEEQIGEIGSKCEKFAKDGSEWFDRWMFARAIERAHGIGGEA